MSSSPAIRADADGPVLRVRLDRPERGNALDGQALRELAAVYASLHDRPEIRVVTLHGNGDSFCVGADRDGLPESDATLAGLANRLCDAVARTEALTIARVQGAVTGLGLALMIACDLRLAYPDAAFRLPELLTRRPPLWGGAVPRLLAEIGPARTRELVLVGRRIDAADAEAYGLVNRTGPAALIDQLESRWIRRVLRADPTAGRLAKAQLYQYEERRGPYSEQRSPHGEQHRLYEERRGLSELTGLVDLDAGSTAAGSAYLRRLDDTTETRP
ncbi:enoyl-CoA hydratase/isomerase family protein [Streptomyces sp. NPDC058548]|uniref:enoyl-CoA hydratase/isomerase family protein n=1 Tax=unclassified Streptomyces TaxID=2593676 RepID=UPI0036506D24